MLSSNVPISSLIEDRGNHIGEQNVQRGSRVMKTWANDVRKHKERDFEWAWRSFVTGGSINHEKSL